MDGLAKEGCYRFPEALTEKLREDFAAFCCTDAEGAACIARLWREQGYLCDPHTAAAVFAAERFRSTRTDDAPLVLLSTASPYKFPAAVLAALGAPAPEDEFSQMDALARLTGVPVPAALASLRGKKELHGDLVDVDGVIPYIEKKLTEGV
jgi:threonine synthase